MVDLDNLVTIANTGKFPNLFNASDVENVKGIMEVYPDLFSTDFNNGCALSKSPSLDPRYGFRFQIPTGINQYQFFDGSICENKLFPYLTKFKYLYFKKNVIDFELVDLEPVPLFAPTIEAICQLATEVTGNTDTSSLKGFLEVLENITSELHDYELTTLLMSKSNQYIRIGFDKVSGATVSEDVFKYFGRSNTKIYANTKGLTYKVEDNILGDWENNSVQMYIEFDSTGLKKQLGYGLYTRWKKEPKEGTTAQDDFALYTERHKSHNDTVAHQSNQSWIPTDWKDEIIEWDKQTKSIYATTIVTASSTVGEMVELGYGSNDY